MPFQDWFSNVVWTWHGLHKRFAQHTPAEFQLFYLADQSPSSHCVLNTSSNIKQCSIWPYLAKMYKLVNHQKHMH
jgi:hypothetical protein